MLIARIPGATRNLGAPPGWEEKRDGLCGVLPILDVPTEAGGNVMWSAWEPTPEDLAALAAGAKIYLGVHGTGHPVVCMAVGPVPGDPEGTAEVTAR